ncbi:MAG: seryl-tRNA synthetase [Solirubrobacteraceae bacterium]|jgi:seryl-tRNA synthetase|nr:seryl-tRNA synthetase [Solirubrobacteraceae bacterium]
MLDLRLIRREPDAVRTALARRGGDVAERVDRVLELDRGWRAAAQAAEGLRAEQKAASEEVAAGKREGRDVSDRLARLKALSAEVKARGEEARQAESELQTLLATLPNLPDPTAAAEDEVVRVAGEADRRMEGRDHLELAGERIDMERGARLSGSRFAYLRGDLAMLELALVTWTLHKLRGHGFEPVIPPVLVREHALYGTGFLPDTEQQIYSLPDDDLYLAGTSEVALASLHAGEMLDAAELPLRYAGFSPCFRREAGAAGKDTRGIFRVHQFDKVEMFSFVEPARGAEEHERLLAIEEEIMSDLGIPYRVVNIAVDDLGASAAKKYDIEAWLPGQGRYRELTSTSNTTDFQARRLDIRARDSSGSGGRPEVVHTLNGTAVAVGRTIVALLENGQRDDGSVQLPAVLVPYGAPSELPSAA